MPTFSKFQPFVEALAEGKHDFSADTLEIALSNAAPSAANGVLTDITEIVYTNLSARTLAGVLSSQTAGLYKLDADNKVLTASGAVATFQYVIIFNQDAQPMMNLSAGGIKAHRSHSQIRRLLLLTLILMVS